MAQTLRQIGFEAELGEDLTKRQMKAALDRFAAKVKPGSIAFLFFSGIGLQVGGRTYLIPTDSVIWSEQDVRAYGFNLDHIIAGLEAKGAKIRIAVIDGARRNPFERRFRTSGSLGLAPISSANETLAMYSTAPGNVSEESGSAPGPFVEELVKEIEAPGATAEDAFRRTRLVVSHLSQAGERPWISSSLSEDIVLDAKDCLKVTEPHGPPELSKVQSPAAAAPSSVATPAQKKPENDRTADTASPLPEKDATRSTARAADKGVQAPDNVLVDTALLDEVRDRLFEQNFDPKSHGPSGMNAAIRKFEKQAGLPDSAQPTDRLLQSLREADRLGPWGAIVFSTSTKSWGMSWGRSLRRQALDEARLRCGSDRCTQELSFYGKRCGAFAISSRNWTITWRNGSDTTRKAALSDCAKGGQACRLIGAVCADGSDRIN